MSSGAMAMMARLPLLLLFRYGSSSPGALPDLSPWALPNAGRIHDHTNAAFPFQRAIQRADQMTHDER